MSRPRTVDVADSADWSWVQVPELYERFLEVVDRVAREKTVGAADLAQDLALHISVRPTFVDRNWCDEAEVEAFLHKALMEGRTIARRSTANRWRLEYIEDHTEQDEEMAA